MDWEGTSPSSYLQINVVVRFILALWAGTGPAPTVFLKMTLLSVIAKLTKSAEAISWRGNEIATLRSQ